MCLGSTVFISACSLFIRFDAVALPLQNHYNQSKITNSFQIEAFILFGDGARNIQYVWEKNIGTIHDISLCQWQPEQRSECDFTCRHLIDRFM